MEHRKYNSPWINKITIENFGEQPVSKEAANNEQNHKNNKITKNSKKIA